MRVCVIAAWQDPAAPELTEIPIGLPGPGEVRVRIHTATVNFGDCLIASGRYQIRPSLPFVPGTEGAGIVDAIGPDVDAYTVGDLVAISGFVGDPRRDRRIPGTFAEAVVVPTANLARAHPALSLEESALLRSSIETSYEALHQGRLKAGETLLVLGAAGGTGAAAVQLGKWLGARVVASASTDEKRAMATASGADATLANDDPAWREHLLALTDGRGPDVVFDPVGGPATERAFRTLAWGGRLLVVGFAAGAIPAIATNLALLKGAAIIGVNLLQAAQFEPDRIAEQQRTLFELCGRGLLRPVPVSRRYTLAEAPEALAAVSQGRFPGRVVITVNDGVST